MTFVLDVVVVVIVVVGCVGGGRRGGEGAVDGFVVSDRCDWCVIINQYLG